MSSPETWPHSFLLHDSQSGDKTWVEDPPSRVPYDSLYQQPDAEEENTDKFFIALIVIYILGLSYCGYHVSMVQLRTMNSIKWSKNSEIC